MKADADNVEPEIQRAQSTDIQPDQPNGNDPTDEAEAESNAEAEAEAEAVEISTTPTPAT